MSQGIMIAVTAAAWQQPKTLQHPGRIVGRLCLPGMTIQNGLRGRLLAKLAEAMALPGNGSATMSSMAQLLISQDQADLLK